MRKISQIYNTLLTLQAPSRKCFEGCLLSCIPVHTFHMFVSVSCAGTVRRMCIFRNGLFSLSFPHILHFHPELYSVIIVNVASVKVLSP